MTVVDRSATPGAAPRTAPFRSGRPRAPGDPAPDLLDYRVVHRAMTRDLARLAAVADELVAAPDRRRLRLLRRHLHGMTVEIVNHHRVEDDDVWPLLEAVAGDRTALVALTEDHERLDPLLARAGELAVSDVATPQLAATLHELADLLARHVADEERDVFPIIAERVRVEDYARLQERFRGTLGLATLTFVVPWVVGHATPAERRVLLADAPPALRVILALTERRFLTRAGRLFGKGLSPRDRRMVILMKVVTRAQVAIVRATHGRRGHRWIAGTEVVALTTTGRRSGQARTVMVLALPDGDDLLVAASHGGVDREPPWWLNLQAEPHARVAHRGEHVDVVAEEVGDDEYAALWARFVAAWPGFEGYRAKVRRRIALVRLRPSRT
ncbi:nitroreductase/quinone reductase family protein [Actinomycetospora straminea]|uniref:Hemerythrin-like domain-containing protein n=1 Tax=Actinomycetospora straminea TaxID=663607 RepID=A0ABP9EDQ4_9PSEU|nr:nitroreductase/quinone reductase family protein [Actinomycetospora straminea]MDD7934353.1 nitroreductase/quinone reductase family protein [Actinomycetospora straminea]